MLGDISCLFFRFSNGVLTPPHEHYYDYPEVDIDVPQEEHMARLELKIFEPPQSGRYWLYSIAMYSLTNDEILSIVTSKQHARST